VEYIHDGATGGPGNCVACLVDMTSDVPAADTTILIPAASGNEMLYVRSGATRLGISRGSIAKMWTAWKASPLSLRQSPPLSDGYITNKGCTEIAIPFHDETAPPSRAGASAPSCWCTGPT
jgi:hypothetical protein